MKAIRYFTRKQIIVALGFVLTVIVGAAWAVQFSSSVSGVVELGGGGRKVLVDNEHGKVVLKVHDGSLDEYLIEHGINEVELWCDFYAEGWWQNGEFHIESLDFLFGPDGAYFNPPMEIRIMGDYALWNPDIRLYSEDGEEMEFHVRRSGTALIIEIPHFSSYSYDHYD